MATLDSPANVDAIEIEKDIDEAEDEEEIYPIDEYDLVSSPNDFNTRTLVDFIDQGVVTIPGFQRNFVWDIKRSSRLIESIIVGLPVPQIFLYETGRNEHLVIDGQQRLMSIYYFVKQRFPRKDKLQELRMLAKGDSVVPEELLSDNRYFTSFRLNLPESVPGHPNKFHGQSFETLDEDKRSDFDLRTIRHIIVRQIGPAGDEAMYEIFNRLNSGGMNLAPQEIRRCAFDSKFYEMLYETNVEASWRRLVGTDVPDIHSKDVEILLRGFAMLDAEKRYSPSMVRFLNMFSIKAKTFGDEKILQLRQLLDSFVDSCADLGATAFHSTPGRFSPMVFESVFVAICGEAFAAGTVVTGKIDPSSIEELKEDPNFRAATQRGTTRTENVRMRLDRARSIIRVS